MVAPEKPQSAPKTAQFAVGVRGYNQRQVDERLAELTKELRETSRNRDDAVATSADLTKALAYAQKELAETKAALARMSSSPSGAGAMAERVRMMMQLAEEEIADLRSAAEADAASTRDQAGCDARRLNEINTYRLIVIGSDPNRRNSSRKGAKAPRKEQQRV